jgi:hypothetical protein
VCADENGCSPNTTRFPHLTYMSDMEADATSNGNLLAGATKLFLACQIRQTVKVI